MIAKGMAMMIAKTALLSLRNPGLMIDNLLLTRETNPHFNSPIHGDRLLEADRCSIVRSPQNQLYLVLRRNQKN